MLEQAPVHRADNCGDVILPGVQHKIIHFPKGPSPLIYGETL